MNDFWFECGCFSGSPGVFRAGSLLLGCLSTFVPSLMLLVSYVSTVSSQNVCCWKGLIELIWQNEHHTKILLLGPKWFKYTCLYLHCNAAWYTERLFFWHASSLKQFHAQLDFLPSICWRYRCKFFFVAPYFSQTSTSMFSAPGTGGTRRYGCIMCWC